MKPTSDMTTVGISERARKVALLREQKIVVGDEQANYELARLISHLSDRLEENLDPEREGEE